MRDASLAVAFVLAATALAGCLAAPDPAPAALAPAVDEVFSRTAVFEGVYDTAGPYARPLLEGAFGILEPEVVELASELDGASIQMGLVRPDVPEGTPVPVIAIASPFFAAMTPESIKAGVSNPRITLASINSYQYYAEPFVPRGYAVAFIATRGSAGSGGCWEMLGPREQADLDQAVTWLGEAPWSNGNFGMIGMSYEGSTLWLVAAKGNPHLKTVVPMNGITDLFTDFVRGGSPSLVGPLFVRVFYPYGFGVENNPTNGRSLESALQGALCPEAWRGVAAIAASSVLAERQPADFWEARNFRPGAEANYRGSVFAVTGPADYLLPNSQTYPFMARLEERGVVVKHLLGQWWHNPPDANIFPPEPDFEKRWDWGEILLHWFDYWLKGDTTVDLGPKAQAQDTSGAWRNEANWPPPDARPAPLYLGPSGGLSREPASGVESVLVASDPYDEGALTIPFFAARNLAGVTQAHDPEPPLPCPACPRFATEPLAEQLRFAGLPELNLTVVPTGPGGHIAAFLYVQGADGHVRVGRGQLDLRLADGTGTPKPVAPAQRLAVHLVFEPLDVVVPAGARLVLELTQGAIEGSLASVPTYPIRVAVGGDASMLTLMTFERGPEAFFTPPGVAT